MDDNQAPQNDATAPEAPEAPETPVAPDAPVAAPVPPVEPAPVPPIEPAPAAVFPPPAAAYPPPVVTPVPPVYGAPVATPPSGSGKTIGIVIAIIAACVLVLAGLGTAIFLVAQSAIRSLDAQTPTSQETNDPRDPAEEEGPINEGTPEILPLVQGEPGPATAIHPTACPGACFDEDVFGEIGLDSDSYGGLGALEQSEAWGDYADTTPSKEYTYTSRYWKDNEGTPDACFPIYMQIPVATPLEVRPDAPDDVIAYLGYYANSTGYSGLQESARLFTDSAAAEAHMVGAKDLIAACSRYEIGSGSEYWTADVTPAPALSLPEDVAAVGWVEDAPFGGRYYAIDLQRANLVVRAAFFTDGEVTEEEYRAYVEDLAEQLAGLPTR